MVPCDLAQATKSFTVLCGLSAATARISGTVTTVVSDSLREPVFAPDGRSGSFADEGRQLDLLRINCRVLRQADLDTSIAGRPAEAVVAGEKKP